MTEVSDNAVDKIISFKTGKPIDSVNIDNVESEPQDSKEKPVEETPTANQDISSALEVLSSMNQAGRLKNIAVIAWDSEAERWQRAIIIPTADLANDALRINGALDLLKNDMMNITQRFSDYFTPGES